MSKDSEKQENKALTETKASIIGPSITTSLRGIRRLSPLRSRIRYPEGYEFLDRGGFCTPWCARTSMIMETRRFPAPTRAGIAGGSRPESQPGRTVG
jgi:hypothetical protein